MVVDHLVLVAQQIQPRLLVIKLDPVAAVVLGATVVPMVFLLLVVVAVPAVDTVPVVAAVGEEAVLGLRVLYVFFGDRVEPFQQLM